MKPLVPLRESRRPDWRCRLALSTPRSRCAVVSTVAILVAACSGEMPLAPGDGPRVDASAPPPATPQSSTAPTNAPPKPVVAAAPAARPPAPPASPPPPPKPEWQVLLEDGIDSFESGDYGSAIRKLGDVANNPQADDATRIKALKYLAFSFCVSPAPAKGKTPSHLTLCRQAFERALAIDANFDLAPGERTHPVWGKQFVAARNAQLKKPRAGGDVKARQAASSTSGSGPSLSGGTAAATSKP